jgi:hypothetical protein
MPIRFTSPSLGGHRQVVLAHREWELGLSYRRLTADDWFVGSTVTPAAAPFGQPNRFNVNTLDFSLAYGVTDRLSVRLNVPFSTGTNSRVHPDLVRHETSATGIGDINLVGNYWLLDPVSHQAGNVGLGLGLKAPTGSYHKEDGFGLATGNIQFPVHPGLQPGGGGWGILVEAQAYQRLAGALSGYVFGAYQMSPEGVTDVTFSPTAPGSFLSVNDVYHARAGLAYALLPQAGVSVSLGGRIDGIPVRDIIGSDEGYRAPGSILFLDPGLSITRGKGTFTASVPVRLRGTFKPPLLVAAASSSQRKAVWPTTGGTTLAFGQGGPRCRNEPAP